MALGVRGGKQSPEALQPRRSAEGGGSLALTLQTLGKSGFPPTPTHRISEAT